MTAHHGHPSARALSPLVLTMVLWGSAFSVSSLALKHVGPQPAAALRYGIAAVFMLAWLRSGRGSSEPVSPLSRRQWGWFALAGLIGIATYNGLFFLGLSLAPAIDGSSIMPVMSPVFTAALASLFARERPGSMRLGALALGLGGAFIVLLSGSVTTEYPQRLLGDVFFLGAAFCWAIYTLMGRRLMGMAEPFRVSAWAMTFGGLFLALWAAPELLAIDWTELSADFWLEIVYLALLPTAIGYALYYRGVRDVGPTTASIMMFLVPISGALLAVLSTGARFRWRSVVAR
jgi:drug/metabolite transporter (DMT)-like permease